MGIHLTEGYVQISADSTPLTLGRTSDAGRGEHIIFRNASSMFGVIGDYNGVPYFGYTHTTDGGGIMFNGSSIEPTNGGSGRQTDINDIGSGNFAFRDAHFSASSALLARHHVEATTATALSPTATTDFTPGIESTASASNEISLPP